ncbi:MAG: L28 family ribosomal protein [Saccharofermentanales bacterium]|jgi:large subunit ribosomal protein L28|nr:L28 family ribosomal protein [Eubacteriales bacterium]MDD3610935.1 L28 family ribosomal protein [Eubacteriales bacterium]HHU04022.1 50S ribosomal protein L28 [Fastidiosipila sp.]
MAKCEVCQKDMFFGRKLSITRSQIARRAKNRQRANIKRVRVMVDGTPKRMNVCTNCLKSGRVERA